MTYRKKLIEVALPLDAINAASAREKSIRHGHPSTLHLWWARRPLAACRAVLFAQLVDDPGSWPERFETEELQSAERERLHDLIRRLVPWEASNDERVLNEARFEIARSFAWNRGEEPPARDEPKAVLDYLQTKVPPVYDPFCGGGSIPLEAQRLGLRAIGSDLNPVAVMITKALIEFPPRFAGLPPVNPESRRQLAVGGWKGAKGLAEDVRHYGKWMRDEAEKRIGHLYPRATLPDGLEATVIAWLWARTVRSPNPAANGAMVPLVSSFLLSTKEGRQAWVEPVIDASAPDGYRFEVRTGKLSKQQQEALGEGTIGRKGGHCVLTQSPMPFPHVRAEGRAGRMSERLMAIVAEGSRGRVYLAPDARHEQLAATAKPSWKPEQELPENPRDFKTPNYGMTTFGDLFTPRQLVALTTFSDLVGEARAKAAADAAAAGLPPDPTPLAEGGHGAEAYADAVAVYLAFAVDKAADRNTTLCAWESKMGRMRNTFGRQALPMVWDYTETNPIAGAAGDIAGTAFSVYEVLSNLVPSRPGSTILGDASRLALNDKVVIATDPPYYDNIGYADLSDFFYIWMRRMLRDRIPMAFDTMLVPKTRELVATPYRHGGKEEAEEFFMAGMSQALHCIERASYSETPVTIYYAYKQSEVEKEGVTSTGWATFLEAMIAAGFQVDGTWPIRTELGTRAIGRDANALASSIVHVCRRRPVDAQTVTRAAFLRELGRELQPALRELQRYSLPAVDFRQAAFGPGMALFSRYAAVLESDDSEMRVRTALSLINQEVDKFLIGTDADYDDDTRVAIAWYESHGLGTGPYDDAAKLARQAGVGVNGVVAAGILEARAGKARLLARDELPIEWDPAADRHLTVWEATQQLIRRHEAEGVDGAAALLASLPGPVADAARELAYRLFQVCEKRKSAQEALPYNALVADWPEIQKRKTAYAAGGIVGGPAQAAMAV